MDTITFSQPFFLGLILGVIPWLILAGVVVYWQRRRLLAHFSGRLIPVIFPGYSLPRKIVRVVLPPLVLALLLFALAGPQWGYHWEEVPQSAIDIVLAVDLSASMDTADIKPSRLVRMRQELEDFLGMVRGDRVGLIAFAGEAFLLCPLTTDQETLRLFVDSLDSDLISTPGTNLASLVTVAQKVFAKSGERPKALVILSDGEDQQSFDPASVSTLTGHGVKIYTLGIGTPEGGPVPGSQGGFKKDQQGKVVISRLEEGMLQSLALKSGGVYARSVVDDTDWQALYAAGIKRMIVAVDMVPGERRIYIQRFQIFLLAALVLWVMAEVIKMTASDQKGLGRFFVALGLLLLLPPFWPHHALAEDELARAERAFKANDFAAALEGYQRHLLQNPQDDTTRYNLGNTYYRLGRYAEAGAAYAHATQAADASVRAMATYNLGNSLFRQENLAAAQEAYQQTLVLNPEDEDAKKNLALLDQMLAQQKQAPQEPTDQQDQEKSDQDQKQQDQQGQGSQQEADQGPGQDQDRQPGAQGQQPENGSEVGAPEASQQPSDDRQNQQENSTDQGSRTPGSRTPGSQTQGSQTQAQTPLLSQTMEDQDEAGTSLEVGENLPAGEADQWLKTLEDSSGEVLKGQIKTKLGKPREVVRDW